MSRRVKVLGSLAAVLIIAGTALAYPPSVGVLGPSRNCLACHANNGPWKDDATLVINIFDEAGGVSLKQPDGSFLISVKRGKPKTVTTVIGVKKINEVPIPHRNAWIYVDPKLISDASALNKFAPGWEVNLPMSCRLVGDTYRLCLEDEVTALPMTIRATDAAKDTEIELQVMLTEGDSAKGDAKGGMVGNYFERKVRLKIE